MNRKLFIFLLTTILLLSCCLSLVACTDEPAPQYYTVQFFNGTRLLGEAQVKEGDVIGDIKRYISNSKAPNWAWYTTRTGGIEWNLYSDKVTCDMSLYARV